MMKFDAFFNILSQRSLAIRNKGFNLHVDIKTIKLMHALIFRMPVTKTGHFYQRIFCLHKAYTNYSNNNN